MGVDRVQEQSLFFNLDKVEGQSYYIRIGRQENIDIAKGDNF